MKRIYLLLIAVLFIAYSCNEGENNVNKENDSTLSEVISVEKQDIDENDNYSAEDKKIGVKNAFVEYEINMMDIITKMSTYFKDHGKLTCADVTLKVMGMEMKNRTLVKDGYTYSLEMDKKKGEKFKNTKTKEGFDPNNINYENLSEEIKKKFNIKEIGEEKILGKNTKIFSVDDKGSIGKVWIWKNIPLKTEMEQNSMKVVMTAISINENPTFPDGIFDIPEEFEITEVNVKSHVN